MWGYPKNSIIVNKLNAIFSAYVIFYPNHPFLVPDPQWLVLLYKGNPSGRYSTIPTGQLCCVTLLSHLFSKWPPMKMQFFHLSYFTTHAFFNLMAKVIWTMVVSPVRSTYGGYYGLIVVTPRPPPRPQTLHRSHDNLKNPYRIASIFYM